MTSVPMSSDVATATAEGKRPHDLRSNVTTAAAKTIPAAAAAVFSLYNRELRGKLCG